jgi:hypothetical protein
VRLVVACGLLVAAVAAPFVVAPFPGQVEALFSRRLYPLAARLLAHVTSGVPFPVAEAAALLLVLGAFVFFWTLVGAWRRGIGRRRRLLSSAATRLVLVAAIGYAVFLTCWGFNYRRLPFATTSGLDVGPVAIAELVELADALVAESNALRAGRHEDADGAFRAEAGVLSRAPRGNEVLRIRFASLAGPTPRPKPAWLSPLLSRVGIAGIYIPFTAEPLVNAALPEAELPWSASHEIAHAQGFAREDEANFVAYLACREHPDPDFRYSGSLVASFYVVSALAGSDPPAARRIDARRSEAVRRDVAAIVAWQVLYAGPLRDAGERVNDAYLRSQGTRDGVRSYGRMVDLLVATRRPQAGRVLGSAP